MIPHDSRMARPAQSSPGPVTRGHSTLNSGDHAEQQGHRLQSLMTVKITQKELEVRLLFAQSGESGF